MRSPPESKNSTKKSPLGTHRYLTVEGGREDRRKGRKRREGKEGGGRREGGERKGEKGMASLFNHNSSPFFVTHQCMNCHCTHTLLS